MLTIWTILCYRLRMLAQREKTQLENAIKTCKLTDSEDIKSEGGSSTDAKFSEPTKTVEQPKHLKTQPVKAQPIKTQPVKAQPVKPQENHPKQPEKVSGLPPLPGANKAKTPADAAASWMSSAKAEVAATPTSGPAQQVRYSV